LGETSSQNRLCRSSRATRAKRSIAAQKTTNATDGLMGSFSPFRLADHAYHATQSAGGDKPARAGAGASPAFFPPTRRPARLQWGRPNDMAKSRPKPRDPARPHVVRTVTVRLNARDAADLAKVEAGHRRRLHDGHLSTSDVLRELIRKAADPRS
jgi:hypothetical protein